MARAYRVQDENWKERQVENICIKLALELDIHVIYTTYSTDKPDS